MESPLQVFEDATVRSSVTLMQSLTGKIYTAPDVGGSSSISRAILVDAVQQVLQPGRC